MMGTAAEAAVAAAFSLCNVGLYINTMHFERQLRCTATTPGALLAFENTFEHWQ
jgi:hypothetical protein